MEGGEKSQIRVHLEFYTKQRRVGVTTLVPPDLKTVGEFVGVTYDRNGLRCISPRVPIFKRDGNTIYPLEPITVLRDDDNIKVEGVFRKEGGKSDEDYEGGTSHRSYYSDSEKWNDSVSTAASVCGPCKNWKDDDADSLRKVDYPFNQYDTIVSSEDSEDYVVGWKSYSGLKNLMEKVQKRQNLNLQSEAVESKLNVKKEP